MSLGMLAVGYIALGGLLALVVTIARRPAAADTFLVVVMWPLYAPDRKSVV